MFRTFRYAKYLRKSTEEDHSRSIGNQDAVLCGLVQRIIAQDPVNRYEDQGTYCDEDYTGTDSQRPAFKALLKDLAAGKINMLLVTDLSRLSRNLAESIQYVQSLFVALEVRFVSLQLPTLDSYLEPERVYSMEIPMQSMMNENHCAETSFKVRRTFQQLRRQGAFFGAFAPYGYQKDPDDRHRLLVDEPAAVTVRSIFSWYVLDAMSKQAIAMRLNTLGVPSPAAYKRQTGSAYYNPNVQAGSSLWSPKTVGDILQNPVYTGAVCQGKQQVTSYKLHNRKTLPKEQWVVVEQMHPAIISKAQFDQARQRADRRIRTSAANPVPHLFSGLLQCADCRKAMSRKSSKGRVYYVCRTHAEQAPAVCGRHSIREDRLRQIVSAALQVQLDLLPQSVFQELSQEIRRQENTLPLEKLLRDRSAQCQNLIRLQDEVYFDYKGGTISAAQYGRRTDRLQQQLALAQQQTEAVKRALSEKKAASSDCLAPFAAMLQTRQMTLYPGLLAALVKRIEVHQEGALTIQLSFRELLCNRCAPTKLQPPVQLAPPGLPAQLDLGVPLDLSV